VTAPQNEAAGVDDAIGPLPAPERRVFFDAIERRLAGAAKDGKNRLGGGEVERVIAPLAVRHLIPVDIEDDAKLPAVERDDSARAFRSLRRRGGLARLRVSPKRAIDEVKAACAGLA